MASQPERPRVTEIKVRMDCNGCVQKIKKALHGIIGITELYVDFPQQKLTIVGWADPEKIIKAIKKTRKSAVICLHSEQYEQSADQKPEAPPEDGSPEGGVPPSETTNQAAEPQQTEQVPAQDQTNEPPSTENPPHEPNPPAESTGATTNHSQPSMPTNGGEVHVVYHYPPDHGYAYNQNVYQGYGGPWTHPEDPRYRQAPPQPPETPRAYNGSWAPPRVSSFRRDPPQPPEPSEDRTGPWVHPGVPRFREESPRPPQPISVSHNYNTYKPSAYVTEYAYPRPPPSYNTNYGRQVDSEPRESRENNYNTYRPSPSPEETQEYNNIRYRPLSDPIETRPTETREYRNTYRPSPGPTETRTTETREYSNTYRPPPGPIETCPTEMREYSNNTYRPSPGPVETREYINNTYRPSPNPAETREYNYNTYRSSPYTAEYAYSRSSSSFNPHYGSPTPPSYYSPYFKADNFNQEYYNGNQGNGNVTSMFSEENPNACTIV